MTPQVVKGLRVETSADALSSSSSSDYDDNENDYDYDSEASDKQVKDVKLSVVAEKAVTAGPMPLLPAEGL